MLALAEHHVRVGGVICDKLPVECRPAPATAEDGSEGRSIEPIYFVDIRRGWQALQTASPTTRDGPPKRGARQYCGVTCLIS